MILKNFILYLIYFISFIFPRNKNIWVFGSYGLFNDNSKYLFLEESTIRKIWIAKSRKEFDLVRSKGCSNVYMKKSIKGIYYCLRAKVYVYSCYVSDINFCLSGGVICINLWHGIPLKVIEFDIKEGVLKKRFNKSLSSKYLYPHVYRKHDFVLCPSEFVYNYSFRSAFRMKEENKILWNYPRIDDLKSHKKNTSDYFNILYVPTWRDFNPNFLDEEFFNLELINSFCKENNCIFNIKLHSNSKFKIDSSKYEMIKVADNNIDSNNLMKNSDILISDYSSIVYDYLFVGNPIILYNFDKESYKNNSRKFYSEISGLKFAEEVNNLNDLLGKVYDLINGNDQKHNLRVDVKSKLFLPTDTKRTLTEAIIEKVKN